MKKFTTKVLAYNAVIAALYIVLTMSFMQLSYGLVQIRFSEALTVLPTLIPYSYIGIAIGCLVSNIPSPLGLPDIILGTLISLVAGYITSKIKNPYLAALPPVLLNALFLPLIWYIFAGEVGYFINVLSLLISQSLVIYLIGIPLYYIVKKYISPTLLTN